MTDPEKKYLSDILHAIELIEEFTKGCNSFFEYQSDSKTKSAVERQLEIIGEAVGKLRRQEQESIISHAHQIVAVRNRLIHAYDAIDDTIIWAILKKHLPVLKAEVIAGLQE